MGPITKPLKLKPISKPTISKPVKDSKEETPAHSSEAPAQRQETESERQLRLAKKLKHGNSYEAKRKAFNQRLAKASDFNDVPKMKG